MGATFIQNLINVRERFNQLENHRHDALYEKRGTFLGVNLIVNHDKSVSQRGDFSTPFVPNAGVRYLDKYFVYFLFGNVTLEYSHGVFNTEVTSRTVLISVTSTNSSVDSYVVHKNVSIENSEFLNGKLVTYSALIRSNTNSTLNIDGHYSNSHSGSGEWELLSVTLEIPIDATYVLPEIYMTYPGTGTELNDYMEIGNEKLELGTTFTGFEYKHYNETLQACRSSMIPLTSDQAYGSLGNFVTTSTTSMICTLFLTPMNDTLPSLSGISVNLSMLGAGSGTITGILIDATNTNMLHGKLSLQVLGTGFVVGETNIVRKDNDTEIMYIKT